MSKLPRLKKPWKKLPKEEVDAIMERLKDSWGKSPFDSTVGGILPCACGGTGRIKVIGGPDRACPYCSPKIG